jgi:alkylmercury lyase
MLENAVSTVDEEKLIENMAAYLDAARQQVPGLYGVIKRLARGIPLDPGKLAAELDLKPRELEKVMRIAEKDEHGNLVGFGISLVPTAHKYQVEGRQLYTWCAADAIMFSIFLKSDAVVESRDPVSGETIELTSTPTGIRQLEPKTTVVSHVSEGQEFEYVRKQLCNVTHFFASPETAQKYVEEHPGLHIMPVDQVFEIWSRVYDREPYKSMFAEL